MDEASGIAAPRGESEMRTEYCLKVEGMGQLASYKLIWDNNCAAFYTMGVRRTKCKDTNCTVLTQDRFL